MNYKVIPTPSFKKEAKALAKRYKSMKTDLDGFRRKSIEENPFQGTELSPGIRKVRMTIESKGKGKSGGARVIIFVTDETTGRIWLLEIYDKSDYSTVKVEVIKKMIKDLGL